MYRPPSKVATSGSLTSPAGVVPGVAFAAFVSDEAPSPPPQAVRTADTARARAVPEKTLVRIDVFTVCISFRPHGGGVGVMRGGW